VKKIFQYIVFGLLVISTIFNVLFLIGVTGDISSQWLYICIGAVMLFNAVYAALPPREQYVFDWFNLKGHRKWSYTGLSMVWVLTSAIVFLR